MAEKKEYDIFISYRRESGKNYARILKPELEKRGYQDRVFLDFDELKDGKFDKRIIDAINSAPVFLIILSKGCLDRCVNTDDWVRQEIMHALQADKHIIPVVCDKTFDDFPANIPEEIKKGLGQHQFSQIDTDTLLRVSVDQLVNDRINPATRKNSASANAQSEVGAEIHIITDTDCHITRFGRNIATAYVDKENSIRLLKGNHLLEFVCTEDAKVKQSLKYSVPDNDYSDFIEITLQPILQERINQNKKVVSETPIKEETKQTPIIKDEDLESFEENNGLYGFRNKNTKEIIIPAKWIEARDFSEGLAPVRNDSGKWGFIDKNGKITIPFNWNDADIFSEGLAPVENDSGEWGFIDKSGKLIIPCNWSDACCFSEGLAEVRNYCWEYGFIDKNGKIAIPCNWSNTLGFSEGMAPVQDENHKWGYIDKTGNLIIPCIWKTALYFHDGTATVRDENGKKFKINKSGKIIE